MIREMLIDGIHTPEELAQEAALAYVHDASPGMRRVTKGSGFHYVLPDGDVVKDERTLKRIASLAIPPAWRDVWICPSPNGHLQATGRDTKGKKQYRYHPKWNRMTTHTTFSLLSDFGDILPDLRSYIHANLAKDRPTRDTILSAILYLLDTTYVRIGNEEYARDNASYGLTTLTADHLKKLSGDNVRLSFMAKSGKRCRLDIRSKRIARILRRCQELPGQELFLYEEEDKVHPIHSHDVNAFLQEFTGKSFTAKFFRTWHGSVIFTSHAARLEERKELTAKDRLVASIDAVADALSNTRAVCRNRYVHPFPMKLTEEEKLSDVIAKTARHRPKHALYHPDEKQFLGLLKEKGANIA